MHTAFCEATIGKLSGVAQVINADKIKCRKNCERNEVVGRFFLIVLIFLNSFNYRDLYKSSTFIYIFIVLSEMFSLLTSSSRYVSLGKWTFYQII